MFGKRMVLHSAGVLSAAELGCLVKEEDVVRHESFTAEWRDLSLSTRPEEGTDFEMALAGGALPSGQCRDKRAVSEITKELPPVVQPSRPDFGKGDFPRSLSRSLSQEAQRG
ncbi:Telethonin [Chelonia mydas]|uniref:Telethonin n=1 Tax=Chelonia mydas TaxID=8469 RepID=M7BPC1_CHEMY|nr:Telethonin [Chelonia mydas]